MLATRPNPIQLIPLVFAVLLLMALIGGGMLAGRAVESGEVSSPAGPSFNPPPGDRGQRQEDVVRDSIQKEGYEQPFGRTDVEIRNSLKIDGKTADIVGYHPGRDRWLIAESKGGDIRTAVEQIKNTLQYLAKREPSLLQKADLRIYTNENQFQKFVSHPDGLGGWKIKEGYLGWVDDVTNEWHFADVGGLRISVLIAP